MASAYTAEANVVQESSSSTKIIISPGATVYLKEAEQYYRAALNLAPLRQDVILPLADNLLYQGRISDAIKLLIQCYEEDPKVVVSNYELGYVLSSLGNQYYSEAIPLLNFALKGYAETDSLSQLPLGDQNNLDKIYESFAGYFYDQRDSAHFVMAMDGLGILKPSNLNNINTAIDAAESGDWSKINMGSL